MFANADREENRREGRRRERLIVKGETRGVGQRSSLPRGWARFVTLKIPERCYEYWGALLRHSREYTFDERELVKLDHWVAEYKSMVAGNCPVSART